MPGVTVLEGAVGVGGMVGAGVMSAMLNVPCPAERFPRETAGDDCTGGVATVSPELDGPCTA